MATIDIPTLSAVKVPCPLCGHMQLFEEPAALRSVICDGCNRYVCEIEWHESLTAWIETKRLVWGSPHD